MSVGNQFKRQGEIAAAAGLWGLIIFLFVKHPIKTILIVFALIFGFVYLISPSSPDSTWFVKVEAANIRSFPEGDKVGSLNYNDSIQGLCRKAEWIGFQLGQDTVYVKEELLKADAKYNRWDALGDVWTVKKYGEKELIILNHPDKHIIHNDKVIKNGERLGFRLKYNSNEIGVRYDGTNFTLPIEYVQVDWPIVKKYFPYVDVTKD